MLINYLIYICYSAVISIDLGAYEIKVSYHSSSGHHFSHYYYDNIFAYVDEDKWSFSKYAKAQCYLYPDTCIQNQRLPLNDNVVFSNNNVKGYELVSKMLKGIVHKVMSEKNVNKTKAKVIIIIPPSMTLREKNFLYASCLLAKINCVQFVTSTYAPIEEIVNTKKNVKKAVVIDIGHIGVRVSAFEVKHGKIEQKFVSFNDEFGGETIDDNLMNLIIQRNNIVISNNDQRNYYLLLSRIRKARQKLSKKMEVTFEYKNQDIYLNRKDVEDCTNEIKQILKSCIESLFNNNNLFSNSDVYLIGGCSKTPYHSYTSSNGACYILDDEIGSKSNAHGALNTNEIILNTNNNIYNLFTFNDFENFGPVIRLNHIHKNQIFQIIDKSDNERVYSEFTINNKHVKDVGFSLNYYLLPILDDDLSVNYHRIGWEIDLNKDKKKLKKRINQKFIGSRYHFNYDIPCKEIDDYENFVEGILKKKYFIFNWRRIACASHRMTLDNSYKECLENNEYECPKSEIIKMLDDYKANVYEHIKDEL